MSPKTITSNTLFYGDNLGLLREHIADASIDLVYLCLVIFAPAMSTTT